MKKFFLILFLTFLSSSVFLDLEESPQFPFEIYMQSQSLYFARSDGKTTDTINGEITASGTAARTSHILCQISGSVGESQKMQIYFDGTKIAETLRNLILKVKSNINFIQNCCTY